MGHVDRVCLAMAGLASVGVFQALAGALGWPAFARHEASMFASASPAAGLAVVLLGMGIVVGIASPLLGRIRHEAGLFTACIGLAAVANRGGTVSSLLRATQRPTVYRTMLFETIALFAIVVAASRLLAQLTDLRWVPRELPDAEEEDLPDTLSRKAMAILSQALVTGGLLLLLARSESQKQAMASVLLASIIGSVVAHQSFPTRPSAWFWAGPFLVAIVGDAWALRSPGEWAIGHPANALASVSPLSYASLGTAGAIFGYWVSRQWREGVTTLDENAAD